MLSLALAPLLIAVKTVVRKPRSRFYAERGSQQGIGEEQMR